MNSMLTDMASFAAAYINDIVIFSTNFEELLNHQEAVFTWLEETGLILKPKKKCNLADQTASILDTWFEQEK